MDKFEDWGGLKTTYFNESGVILGYSDAFLEGDGYGFSYRDADDNQIGHERHSEGRSESYLRQDYTDGSGKQYYWDASANDDAGDFTTSTDGTLSRVNVVMMRIMGMVMLVSWVLR